MVLKKIFGSVLISGACLAFLTGCSGMIALGMGGIRYDHAENYRPGAVNLKEKVEKLDIDWISGSVNVKAEKRDSVEAYETISNNKKLKEEHQMHTWLDGKTLHIRFCESGIVYNEKCSKELTVLVPERLLEECEVNGTSAKMNLENLEAENLAVNTVSGALDLKGCAVRDSLEVNTTSGAVSVNLKEAVKNVEINSVSGAADLDIPGAENVKISETSGRTTIAADSDFDKLKITSVSGEVKLILPKDADAEIEYKTVSGSMKTKLGEKSGKNSCLLGKGTKNWSVKTTSGNLTVEEKK